MDMTRSYSTQRAAIVAAMDEMQPGDTIVVHESHCWLASDEICTCKPVIWTYPED